jgi:starch-binding outer membrane protein, SusD/RagB family
MKKHRLIKLILISVIIISNGCMDLTEEPQTFLAPGNFFKTSAQVNSTYTAAMQRLWNQWTDGYSYGWAMFYMDDQIASENYYDIGLKIVPNERRDQFWAVHYGAISYINGALKAVKSGSVIGASKDETDLLIAQGEFLRAFCYFQLVRFWGGVPLYLDNDDPIVSPKPRATVEEVYASIVSDLTNAALILPQKWSDGSNGKPTSGAANGILAKVYLTMATAPLNQTNNYQNALDAVKKVMEDPNYSLEHNITDVFMEANKYGPEMIWAYISTADDPSTPAQIWGPTCPPYGGWPDFRVEVIWDSLFVQQPRKDAYVMDSIDGKYYTQWPDNTNPVVKKFMTPYISEEEYTSYTPTNNVPILRYADVLLMFAEAENMVNGGPTQAAVDAINQIRNRANGYVVNPDYPLLTTSMSKEAFDEAVIQERNLELCFEFDRWFDICRKRLLEKLIQPGQTLYRYRADYTEDDYLMPIPENDLRNNKLLEQNPGYASPE